MLVNIELNIIKKMYQMLVNYIRNESYDFSCTTYNNLYVIKIGS